MVEAAGSLVAIVVLVLAGVVMSRRGWLGDHAVDGLKVLITNVTLPLLLFRAFLQLEPDGRNAILALGVFASCAVMGGIGAMLTRAVRLPAPETRLLFQGFEAGMLDYAFFVALHGSERLSALAALDLGQVVYVFTALLVQMSMLEQARVRELPAASITFPWRDIAASKVLWAIFGGLAISLVVPGFAASLAGPDGFAAPAFDTIGGLTTPLVCLVIGASLAAGLGLGLVFGLLVVPALGFSEWYSKAAIMLIAVLAFAGMV